MEKQANPTRQHLKLVLFALGLMELFLLFLALVFGREVGYKTAFIVCAGFGLIIVSVFVLILLANILVIAAGKISCRLSEKDSDKQTIKKS